MSSFRLATLVGGCFLVALTACSQPAGAPTIVPTPLVSPRAIGSPSAAGPVQIATVQILPQDAIVVLQNTGGPNQPATIDLQDWKLQVGSVTVVFPSGARIAPRQNLAIHTGPAPGLSPVPVPSVSPVVAPTPTTDFYLGQDGALLRQALIPGAELALLEPKGVIVSLYVVPQG